VIAALVELFIYLQTELYSPTRALFITQQTLVVGRSTAFYVHFSAFRFHIIGISTTLLTKSCGVKLLQTEKSDSEVVVFTLLKTPMKLLANKKKVS